MKLGVWLSTVTLYLWLISCSQGKVEVMLSNGRLSSVDDVWLEWEGERVQVGNLAAKARMNKTIHPHVENTLVIEYRDPFGERWSCRMDVYFENEYHGVINASLLPKGVAEFSWTAPGGDHINTAVQCLPVGDRG